MRKTAYLRSTLLLAACAGGAWAGEVRGRLLVDGRPAAGMSVSAVPYETPFEEARRQARRQPEPKTMATTTSGGDGAFLLAVPADPSGRGYRLKVEGQGVVPTLTAGLYDAADTEDIGDEPLQRSSPLAGRVVDEKGQPVPGAEVTLVSRAGAGFGPLAQDAIDTLSVPRLTLTGADGSFRFQEARPQNNRLTIEAKGYASVEMTVRDGAVPKPIPLQPGLALSGVVRAGRAAAAGALVRFEGKADSRWVEAGPDGSFRIADLPAGNGTLIVDGGDQGMAEVHSLTLPEAAAQKLQVSLAPASAIEGRVVEAKTGKPVSRVKVLARSSLRLGVARSGADGRYRIGGLLPQRYRVEADDARYVPYERTGVVVLAGAAEKVDLPLTPASSISGRVVDEDGSPVAGARGRLVPEGDLGIRAFIRQQRPGARASFRSNADGSFRATRLPPGDNQNLTVNHPEFEPRTIGGLNLPAGGAKIGVTVVLSRGLTLSGLLKDGDGNPVSGAEVRLNQTQIFRGGRGGAVAQLNFVGGPQGRERVLTGNDGRFEFKGLTAGDYMLNASKPGFSTASLDPVKVVEGAEPVELTISSGAAITGSVVDTIGNPAEGFIVQARPKGGASGVARMLALGGPANRNVTGPDGTFSLEGLLLGESYDLVAMGAEGPEAQQQSIKAPADGVQLVVPGRGRIAGRVLDAANAQPIADFEIGFNPDRSGRGGGAMVFRFGGAGGRRGQGQRDQVHADDGSFVLDDVPPGTWEVNVDARSYQAGRVGGIVVESGQTKDGVVIKLSHGSAIRGRVLDGTTSRPIPDVRVSADVAGGQFRPPMLDLLNGGGGIPTDADGAFEIDGLSQGRYLVTATHPDYAEASQMVDVKEGVAAAELRIQAGGVLGGVVMSENRRALPGVNVGLEPAGEGGFGGRRGPLLDSKSTISDGSGRFRFDHLTAGRYRLVASLRNRSSSPLDAVLQASEVKEDVQLQLQAGATLRGTVTGLDQGARTNVNVMATGPESYFASARAAADGTFVFEGVPAGAINLRATAGDFMGGSMRSAAGHVTIPDGQTEATAEVAFESGFSITGTITRGGQPVGNAIVNASPRSGAGNTSMSRSDGSGNYQLEGLQQGSYNVFANAPQGGSRSQQVQLEGDLTLDLQIPVARLAGTVVEAGSKQPLADVRVQAQAQAQTTQGGPPRVTMGAGSSTDSNGRFAIEDLEAAAYTLTASRVGYIQSDKQQFTASDQGTDDLVIELKRGEGIGIAARDGILGIPLRGLNARVADAAGALVTVSNVSLDSEGRGEIPSIKPGEYLVTASASGYAPVTFAVTVPSPQVAIALTPGGSLELVAGPATLAQKFATLLDASGRPYALSSDPQMMMPGMVVMTGGGGRVGFSANAPTRLLQHLPPGRYSLAVTGQQQPQPVTVAEGQTTAVTLP